ncbi:MAG: response regulator [Pseudomonadota bacterium]
MLVVDDDPGIRESLKDLLEIEGYEVRTAEHGRDGLALLQRERPCMVLLDLMMPVMDGRQFLQALQQAGDPATADIPITVVSALDQARDLKHRYRCEVLGKPIDIDRLLQVVHQHCSCPPA